MSEKPVHFLDVDLVEDIPRWGFPRITEAEVCICSTKQLLLNTSQNPQKTPVPESQIFPKFLLKYFVYLTIFRKTSAQLSLVLSAYFIK